MAFAEHEVLVHRDAMAVYGFLLNGLNLPSWQEGIRSISLSSGSAGSAGARYQVTLTGPGGRPVAGDFEITQARPGAEIRFQVVAGPSLPTRRVLPQHGRRRNARALRPRMPAQRTPESRPSGGPAEAESAGRTAGAARGRARGMSDGGLGLRAGGCGSGTARFRHYWASRWPVQVPGTADGTLRVPPLRPRYCTELPALCSASPVE